MTSIEGRLGSLTDKFSLGYFPVYRDLLEGRSAASVLEVGTAGGGSMMLWHELCPDGTLVGVDLHAPNVLPDGAVHFLMNQADPGLASKVAPYAPFDLVIDDASHWGTQSKLTFESLWPLVRADGFYVVEDWPVGLDSSPYYPAFGGDSMLRLVQSFIPLIRPGSAIGPDMGGACIPAGGAGSPDEVRYRYGMAILHKRAA